MSRRMERSAFSLLEVLIAASMMLGSVIVLGHLLDIGRRHAEVAEGLTHAQRVCENRLAEIAAGVRPPEPVHDEPLADEPGWLCTTTVDPLEPTGLYLVRVAVYQDQPSAGRPARFELARWLRSHAIGQRRQSPRRDEPSAAVAPTAPGTPP